MATNPDNYLNNGRLNTAVFLLSLLAAALAAEFQVAVKRRRHRSVIANESAIVRVLLVEDDPTIGNAVQDHPRAKGWLVDWAMTLESATIAVAVEAHDVMLLGLHLPDGSGLDALKHMEVSGAPTPLVVMSARDQLLDQMTARVRKAGRSGRPIRQRDTG